MTNVDTKWGTLGYLAYKRTYARKISKNKTEELNDTIDRELRGIKNQLKLNLTQEEIELYRRSKHEMKGSVAGRFMWQLGTKTVDHLGLSSLMNCAFVKIDHPIRPFTWAMDNLMLGSGIGYSIKREHVEQLPKVKNTKIVIQRFDDKQADFILPDTREGWVKLVGKVLKSYFYSGKGFTYSMQLVRGKGEAINGFGGVASGPRVLEEGIVDICTILSRKKGKKVSPIDCLDIMNIIGRVVVAGNVRRSAQIAIGDQDDLEYLKAKRWDLGPIPNWRNMSNNSVYVTDITTLPEEFWDTYKQGEPYGMINLELAKREGRLGETQYPDENIEGFNPSLRAGTKVWTTEGIVPIETLQDKTFTVKNLKGENAQAKCWLSGKGKQLYKITLNSGAEYFCTPEHKWPIHTDQGFVKCDTTELKAGHLLPVLKRQDLEIGTLGSYEDGFAVGWLYADGWITETPDKKPQYGWIVSEDDAKYGVYDKLCSYFKQITGIDSKGRFSNGNYEFNLRNDLLIQHLSQFGVDKKAEGLPTKIWTECSEQFRKGFIDAFFSADGTVDTNYSSCRIAISQSKGKLIDDLADLLGFYGIKSTRYEKIVENPSFPNGKVYDKTYYSKHLLITTTDAIRHFKSVFTLSRADKQEKIEKLCLSIKETRNPDLMAIKSVELTDIYEDVWDVTVFDDTHCFQLSHVITGNCAEQGLANFEVCALAEVFLSNIHNKEEFFSILKLLYKIVKHSLALPSHHKETEEIVHRNMRMGIGITGVMMCTEEQKSWLDEGYKMLREFDKEYSKQTGLNESVKLTTVKPSGTLSLLPGVTPGVHPAPAGKYFIRRITIAADSPLIEVCKHHGYFVEYKKNFDGTPDLTSMVVEFPCIFDGDVPSAEDVDVIDQLETVKFMQKNWSDNSVSVTAYYRDGDLPRMKEYLLENFKDNFKTLSFMLYTGHGFVQAPYEPITKEQYEYLNSLVRPITSVEISEEEMDEMASCGIGGCPIK